MPDMKYGDTQIARKYSKIRNYPQVNQAAVREMHRQVGDLQINDRGIAMRGLLVRHLVLPNRLSGTGEIVQFLAREISKDTYINLMDQYHPAFKSHLLPELDRRLTNQEYYEAVRMAREAGLHRFDRRIAIDKNNN
jgi:putative pyruvate formate lyase activating enzyme